MLCKKNFAVRKKITKQENLKEKWGEKEKDKEESTETKSSLSTEEKEEKKTTSALEKSFVEQTNEAKQKLAKNKWVLLALVAGGGLIVMLFIGLVYDAVVKTGSKVLDQKSVVAPGEAAQENEPQAAEKTPEKEMQKGQ